MSSQNSKLQSPNLMPKQSSKSKQNRQKQMIIEMLEKAPVVQIACQNCKISRSTFYRWKDEDPDFDKQVERALAEGTALVTDLAISKVLSGIKNSDNTMVIFWLKNRCKEFMDTKKINHTLFLEEVPREITPEEEAEMAQALKRVGMGDVIRPLNQPEKRR